MTIDLNKRETIISVRGLTKHFNGGDLQALRGVDTDIHRGEVLVVIGIGGSYLGADPQAAAKAPSCGA